MKAFFDTGVYVHAFFRRDLPREEFTKFFALYDIVVCPIVKHELLLGTIRAETKKELELFFLECPILDSPDTNMWGKATEVMKKLGWKENKQQNDVLIALTAEREEATVITYDRHFEKLITHIDFELILLHEK